jgi:hypothetical protein
VFNREKENEAEAEVANLRLQAITSLPKLAIFSDEAHYTYWAGNGQGYEEAAGEGQ